MNPQEGQPERNWDVKVGSHRLLPDGRYFGGQRTLEALPGLRYCAESKTFSFRPPRASDMEGDLVTVAPTTYGSRWSFTSKPTDHESYTISLSKENLALLLQKRPTREAEEAEGKEESALKWLPWLLGVMPDTFYTKLYQKDQKVYLELDPVGTRLSTVIWGKKGEIESQILKNIDAERHGLLKESELSPELEGELSPKEKRARLCLFLLNKVTQNESIVLELEEQS